MPLYEGECTVCEECFVFESAIKFRNVVPLCPKCMGKAKRVIRTAPQVIGGNDAFWSQNGGKGPYNKQLQCHVTSEQDAIDKGKRRGLSVTR